MSLPRAFGPPVLAAQIRVAPEDFRVDEMDAFEASGEGEHLLLTVEKRGMNTAFAARRIAQWAGIKEFEVGYAGLKDRHAVTTQRFSVRLPKKVAPDLAPLDNDEMKVLSSVWHSRKLPRGALAGNRFTLVLRDVVGERDAIEARLALIAARGVPNWFGEQRFGRDGGNVPAALAMFGGQRVERDKQSMLLSAARSELYNQVLAARVADGTWEGLDPATGQGVTGEVWVLDGSRSVFGPEAWTDILAGRLATFDIHPSAPLWGEGELRSTDASRAIEEAALSDETALALRAGLERARMKQERRALRLKPQELAYRWLDDTSLELAFALPPGCYATTVLAELRD